MDFRKKYKETMANLHAGETAAEDVISGAAAEKKRTVKAVKRYTALAAGLVLIMICAFNYRSIMSFANSLFGLHYTAENSEGEAVELGVVKSLTGFDYKSFMSSEGAVVDETELEGDKGRLCTKRYSSYCDAKTDLEKYGIRLPESAFFEELYGEGTEITSLYISFSYSDVQDKGFGITLQFNRSFIDENGNKLSPSSMQLMAVIETEPKEYLAGKKLGPLEGADEYTLYTNPDGIGFGINKYIVEERKAAHYSVDFIYGNLPYGFSINMDTENEMSFDELKAKLDTITE